MTSDLSEIKNCSTDPYLGLANYKLKKQKTQGQFTVLTYKKSHDDISWQVKHGTIAFFLTLFTGGIGLASDWLRGEWKKAWSGKSIKKIKVPLTTTPITNPTITPITTSTITPTTTPASTPLHHFDPIPPLQANFAYRGSNAEYLLLKDGKACSLDEFKQAGVIAAQQFPRPMGQKTSQELQANESEVMTSQLAGVGVTAVKIPKSLYDLFYLRFNLEDRLEANQNEDDIAKIKEAAQQKFNAGRATSSRLSSRKKTRIYWMNSDGNFSIYVPKINFDLKTRKSKPGRSHHAIVNKRYVRQEAHENYRPVLHQLNHRACDYIEKMGLDPQNLDWASMRKITEALLTDVDRLVKNDAIYNRDDLDEPGEILEFGKHYANKERINQVILGAIWHEYQAPPEVYTIYRGSQVSKDDLDTQDPFSFSFGHSVLGGVQHDARSGCPIGYATSDKDLFAVDIDIRDYENKGEAFRFIHIPPARGPNRLAEWGELGHVRSKVKYHEDGKEGDLKIGGFTKGGVVGMPKKELDVLVSCAVDPQEVYDHNKAARVFFKAKRTLILAKEKWAL